MLCYTVETRHFDVLAMMLLPAVVRCSLLIGQTSQLIFNLRRAGGCCMERRFGVKCQCHMEKVGTL